ncbi:unnamed protein product [Rotaria sp. Silwood2]|nr:unnamed protein product [Rotaria sp. Silwood2]CAF2547403.1 unnamed protein product [Rotaria sp. Silwood2]CAF2767757.1 unnamed protein product [Rotaria sp. Silwood2]CAF4115985.1 unnamed protein product [Rotaria sp. Silwood2]CAF4469265.1 unnamed protein product [Rotaria sp. Silwood2]
MQNNQIAFQDAIARAQQVAQKLAASAPNANKNSPLKRPNSEEDSSAKRAANNSPTQTNSLPPPVLRAQQIAQQINSQLGVKTSNDSISLPLSNQLTFQEDYKIPDKFVGLIIGKGGEQIIRLQAESGCKVQICQLRPEPLPGGPNPPDRLANLCGTRDAIERAKRIMDDIISRGKMTESGSTSINPYSMGGTNIKTIDVMLPSAKCGLVIGKGGENIKRVSEEFGVKMYVVQDSADVDGIEHKPLRIMGESDRVERAKQYVLDSLSKSGGLPNSTNRFNANQNSTTLNDSNSRMGNTPITGPCNEAIYHVPYDKAGIIIGKGGESIKEINRRSGAFVELDKTHMATVGNSSERVFKLRGTPEQIATAQQLMYEKVVNSPGGPGDMLTPILFQQQFNLPLLGTNPIETWNNNNDQYGNSTNNNDPYSQWANAYGQWPQLNSYDQSTSKNDNNSPASKTTASDMTQMDPTWLAYYQQMNYYNMMQSSMTGNTSTSTTATKSTDSTVNTNNTSSTAAGINPTTGQPDYSQQWIEYYRSIGQNELADEIARQMKASNSNTASATTTNSTTNAAQATATAMMMSASNPWAAYAQQWVDAAASNTTNGTNSSTTSS